MGCGCLGAGSNPSSPLNNASRWSLGTAQASTQNQALNAIVFLYRRVLSRDVPQLAELVGARKLRRLPVVAEQHGGDRGGLGVRSPPDE